MSTPPEAAASFDIEEETLRNDDYRRVLWTGPRMQVVLMSLLPGETIDEEVHEDGDQFFRVEKGTAFVTVGAQRRRMTARDGWSVVVPAGTSHEVRACEHGAKLYTIYAPPQHRPGTVEKTKPVH